MPFYEHVFLSRHDISSQQVEALADQFKNVISENGGSVARIENWGLKGLMYRIKKNRKAHFTHLNIDAPHEAIAEMERQMRLSTDVIRFMTVRVDELDNEASVMVRKRDKDDRRPMRRDRDNDNNSQSRDSKPREDTARPSAE